MPRARFPVRRTSCGLASGTLPRVFTGYSNLWSFGQLYALAASGLSGGSLIYANVMLRKDERTFVREDLLDGGYENWPVTRDALNRHYDGVERMQRPQQFPLGAGQPYRDTHKTYAMFEAANQMRLPAVTPPLAVLFAPAPGERAAPGLPVDDGSANLHHAQRSTCVLCGGCDLGCNVGAKNTLDFTYLPAAVAAGAQIRTRCEARTIERAHGGGYELEYHQHFGAREGHRAELLDPSSAPLRRVHARELVLAAGAMGTPYLLLANRAGLPGLSRALGTRVSGNGDYLGWIRNARRSDGSGAGGT